MVVSCLVDGKVFSTDVWGVRAPVEDLETSARERDALYVSEECSFQDETRGGSFSLVRNADALKTPVLQTRRPQPSWPSEGGALSSSLSLSCSITAGFFFFFSSSSSSSFLGVEERRRRRALEGRRVARLLHVVSQLTGDYLVRTNTHTKKTQKKRER